jgi:hypothetical protein
MPRSRKRGSIHPFPHTPSWRSANYLSTDTFNVIFPFYMKVKLVAWFNFRFRIWEITCSSETSGFNPSAQYYNSKDPTLQILIKTVRELYNAPGISSNSLLSSFYIYLYFIYICIFIDAVNIHTVHIRHISLSVKWHLHTFVTITDIFVMCILSPLLTGAAVWWWQFQIMCSFWLHAQKESTARQCRDSIVTMALSLLISLYIYIYIHI